MNPKDKNHETLALQAGFIGDEVGKVYFLLFAAMIVYPMDGACPDQKTGACENNDWVNWLVGSGLSAAACVNIIGVCKERRARKAQEASESGGADAADGSAAVLDQEPASEPS